ncbi:MAG: cupin domain-containing protein [Alphaproteobacteria bacterium]|nr:cupin domain-containing protein [Alphaproteobacteria bacterium]
MILFREALGAPEEGMPPPSRILKGAPRFSTFNVTESDGGLTYAGEWEATPGAWRVAYEEWEFCHILKGVSLITQDGREGRRVEAGDSFVIEPGFTGTWEVIETTRKLYVIRLPRPA